MVHLGAREKPNRRKAVPSSGAEDPNKRGKRVPAICRPLGQGIYEVRTDLTHNCSPPSCFCLFLRARAKSAPGVFFRKPCNKTIRPLRSI